ncbi:MAG TPA: HlyD family type I secretion periplasmic adaptor subunit [Kaistiaceae bacterium]|nr:HlyD family type I secretion periplasmic adaptor subunit [Kaistiaceae bacterium]
MTKGEERPRLSYRRPAFVGLFAIALLFGGSLTWANRTEIDGAVIAPGSVVVKGQPKSVQHLDGGIVSEIRVARGDRVAEGDVLIVLDPTTIAANLAIYKGRLREALVRHARLIAEVAGEEDFEPRDLPDGMFEAASIAAAVAQQRVLMNARRATRLAQIGQYDEKIRQFEAQIAGIEKLIEHKNEQVEKFDQERSALKKLVNKRLAHRSTLLALERSRADTLGQLGEHEAEIARINNSIAETRLSRLQLEREFQETAISDAEETETKTEELRLQIDATAKQLERTVIRAPVSGVVHELNVFTIGGVVPPGHTVMQIVPQTDLYEIELSVETRAIDQVFAGQAVGLRFPAFNQRITPRLDGVVTSISPSSVKDEKRGIEYYRVTVDLNDGELATLGPGQKLVPGMPVEGFLQTGPRAVISYLVKPLADNFERVFRER